VHILLLLYTRTHTHTHTHTQTHTNTHTHISHTHITHTHKHTHTHITHTHTGKSPSELASTPLSQSRQSTAPSAQTAQETGLQLPPIPREAHGSRGEKATHGAKKGSADARGRGVREGTPLVQPQPPSELQSSPTSNRSSRPQSQQETPLSVSSTVL